MNDFYFGCWDQPGHFLHVPTGRTVHEQSAMFPNDFPIRMHCLDGGLLGCRNPNGPEGEAVLSWIGNWTVLSFWDRSVDGRGACNSNFIMRGKLGFSEALEHARVVWPKIFARFKFPIVEARP